MDEGEVLMMMLADLQKEYARMVAPIIRRLEAIYAAKPPPPFMIRIDDKDLVKLLNQTSGLPPSE